MVLRAASLAIVLAACAEGKQIPRTSVTSPGEALFNGYTKPAVDCFKCHNGDGSGTKWAPALAERVPHLTDTQIKQTVLNGKGKMPAFAGKLDNAELSELTTWLRHRFGTQTVTSLQHEHPGR